MPSLNSDNNVSIQIQTTSDNSGVDASTEGLQTLSQSTTELGDTTSNFASDYSKSMKVVGVATATVGIGLTAYAKSSTDYLTGLVKDSKDLGLQTGLTAVQSSQLLAVFSHFNIDAPQVSVAFKTLTKDIQNQRDTAAANALAQQDLQNKMRDIGTTQEDLTNKIKTAQIQIQGYTTDIAKNGDTSGALSAKIQGLQISVQSYQNQLGELSLQTKTYQHQLDATTTPLEKLGIATQNADGSNRSFNDILMSVADAFQKMPDGVDKSADAVQLFGKQGPSLIKVLNEGSQGIQDLESSAEKLGITLTTTNIAAVNKYIDAQRNLKDTNDAMKISVGSLTAPVLTNFDNKLNSVARSALSANSPIKGLTTDVLAFGGPLLGVVGGLTNFLGNLGSAGPLLARFAPLLSLGGLAAIGTTVAVAGLGYGMYKLWENTHKQNDELTTATGVGARTASTVTLLQLALNKQSDAQKDVNKAIADQKTAQEAVAPGQAAAKTLADQVTTAQNNQNTALQQFGINSPQYITATDNVASAEYRYNQQLLTNFGLATNVQTATDNLANARSNLAGSTSDLNRLQDILNTGLDASVTKIANFGPTALNQVTAIDTLQNHLSIIVTTFGNFTGSIQAQVPQINQQLAGISNAIQIYQGQSSALNASLSGAAAKSSTLLQNASINPQHKAGGGSVVGGNAYIVGDNPDGSLNNTSELFIPKQSGTIIPAAATHKLMNGNSSKPSLSITQHIYNNVDYNKGIAEIGFRLAHA